MPIGYDPAARRKYPLIAVIHGGPHGQQGPAFSAKNQALAAKGYASLMVNYRGSTGYGQSFTNLIARDQDGGEGRDVLAGLDAAIAAYPWIDPDRLGVEDASYGGQLTNMGTPSAGRTASGRERKRTRLHSRHSCATR